MPARFQEDEEEEEENEDANQAEITAVKRRGRPPKQPQDSPPNDNNGNPDVTVNISVKDKSCTAFLSAMGVYILYYCRKCVFSSKHMADVTEHIRLGEHLEQPEEAQETVVMEDQSVETFISEPLISDALTQMARDDLQSRVTKNDNVKTGGKYVKVEEHSYAEVTLEGQKKEQVIEDKVEEEALEEDEEEKEEAMELDDSGDDPDFNGGGESEDDDDEDIEEGDEDGGDKPAKKRGRKRKRMDMSINETGDDEDLEGDPMIPRRYSCSLCFYTIFYSLTDYREHRMCHGRNGRLALHCYRCLLAGKKKVMAGDNWGRIKTHLAAFHNVNFKLECPTCPVVLSQHSRFIRHYKSHLYSCKFDFCRYDCLKKEDMDLHLKCHQETNMRHYKCSICGFTSKLKPWKWPIIHSHIVRRHAGSISANFTCQTCSAGFHDTNSYIDHKQVCGKDILIKCDLCEEQISKASMMKHAVWHVKQGDKSMKRPRVDEDSERAPSPPIVEASEVTDLQRLAEEAERQALEAAEHESVREMNAKDKSVDAVSDVADSLVEQSGAKSKTSVSVSKDVASVSEPVASVSEPVASVSGATASVSGATASVSGASGSRQEDENEVYRCVEHEETFDSPADLTLHYVTVHWGISQQKMTAATREFERRIGEREEKSRTDVEDEAVMQKIHRMEQSSHAERCQHCYKKFASFPRLLRHMQRCHTEEKLTPLSCPHCKKQYRNRSQFRNHYRIVHEGIKRKKPEVPYKPRKRLFICEMCGYTTPENIRLKNHRLSVHVGVMPYTCDVCDYKTNEKSDMSRHKMKHSGIKRHACEYCSYRTDQRWLLVNHCQRQHDVRLPRIKRDTRGTYWSNRKKREVMEQVTVIQDGEEITYSTLENLISLQAVQDGEEVTVLMTAPEDYEGEYSEVVEEGEDVIAVQSLKEGEEEEEEHTQVVYMREDGTILEPEEAALMLLSVEEEGGQQPLVILPDAIQVQETVAETVDHTQNTVHIIEDSAIENVVTIDT